MGKHCRNVCDQLAVKKNVRRLSMEAALKGQRFCEHCRCYFVVGGAKCICCGNNLRGRLKAQGKYRKRFLKARYENNMNVTEPQPVPQIAIARGA